MIEKATSGSPHALEAKRKIHFSRLPGPEDGAALERTLGKVGGVLRIPANYSKGWGEEGYMQTKTDDQNRDLTSPAYAATPASVSCNKPPTTGH